MILRDKISDIGMWQGIIRRHFIYEHCNDEVVQVFAHERRRKATVYNLNVHAVYNNFSRS